MDKLQVKEYDTSNKILPTSQPLKTILSSQPLDISSLEANIFSEKYKEGEDYNKTIKSYTKFASTGTIITVGENK